MLLQVLHNNYFHILFHAKELGIEVKTASSGLTEDEEQLVKLSLFPETESDSATVEEVSESVDEKVETEELENNEILETENNREFGNEKNKLVRK